MQNYPPINSKKTKSTPITYRRMRNRLVKYGAIGYILNAAIYLIAEFIAALGTNQDLGYVYSKQFISALGVYPGQIADGVPNNFSPLAIVMNLGFIVTAFGFSISYALLLYPKLKDKNTKLACSLMMVAALFSIGSLLVGLFQGGVPNQDSLHGIGARLSFLMGNLTLLLAGIFLKPNHKIYRLTAILLSIIGISFAFLLQYAITNKLTEVAAIYERLTVYPITAWQIITGIIFLKESIQTKYNLAPRTKKENKDETE